eukprot:ANDGO_02016.mRNA.1 hypothetical protein
MRTLIDLSASANGRIFSNATHDRTCFEDGSFLSIVQKSQISGKQTLFSGACFSPDGQRLFVVSDHGKTHVFYFDSNRYAYLRTAKGSDKCFPVSVSNSEIVLFQADHSLAEVSIANAPGIVQFLKFHTQTGKHLSAGVKSRVVVSSDGRSIALWSRDHLRPIHSVQMKQKGSITDVCVIEKSGKVAVCTDQSPRIQIANLATLTMECSLQLPNESTFPLDACRTCALSPDGLYLFACGPSSNEIHVFEVYKKLDFVTSFSLASDHNAKGFEKIVFCGNEVAAALTTQGAAFLFHTSILPQSNRGVNEELAVRQPLCILSPPLKRIISILAHPIASCIVVFLNNGEIILYDLESLVKLGLQTPGRHQALIGISAMAPTRGGSNRQSKPAEDEAAASVAAAIAKTASRTENLQVRAGLDDSNILLNQKKLSIMLSEVGEFPEKYRPLVWRFLLGLPENNAAFDSLVSRGPHREYANAARQFPIRDHIAALRLQKVCSTLAHLSPIFAESSFVPEIVFPFLHVFRTELVHSFEAVLTIFFNPCQDWFTYHPHPPLHFLHLCDDVLRFFDSPLRNYLNGLSTEYGQVVFWPALRCLFADQLSRDEWLIFMDHWLVHQLDGRFLLSFLCAWCHELRYSLLSAKNVTDLDTFSKNPTPVVLRTALRVAKSYYHKLLSIREVTFVSLAASVAAENTGVPLWDRLACSLSPLPKRQYPIFKAYPEFVVNYQLKERERLENEIVERRNREMAIAELELLEKQKTERERAFMEHSKRLVAAKKDLEKDVDHERRRALEERTKLHEAARASQVETLRDRLKVEEEYFANREELQHSERERILLEYRKEIEELRKSLEIEKEEERMHKLELEAAQRIAGIAHQNNVERERQLLSNIVQDRRSGIELEEGRKRIIRAEEDRIFSVKMERFREERRKMEELRENLEARRKVEQAMSLEEARIVEDSLRLEMQRKLRHMEAEVLLHSEDATLDQRRAEELRAQSEAAFKKELMMREQAFLDAHMKEREDELLKLKTELQTLRELSHEEADRQQEEIRKVDFEVELQERREHRKAMLREEEEKLQKAFDSLQMALRVERDAVDQARRQSTLQIHQRERLLEDLQSVRLAEESERKLIQSTSERDNSNGKRTADSSAAESRLRKQRLDDAVQHLLDLQANQQLSRLPEIAKEEPTSKPTSKPKTRSKPAKRSASPSLRSHLELTESNSDSFDSSFKAESDASQSSRLMMADVTSEEGYAKVSPMADRYESHLSSSSDVSSASNGPDAHRSDGEKEVFTAKAMLHNTLDFEDRRLQKIEKRLAELDTYGSQELDRQKRSQKRLLREMDEEEKVRKQSPPLQGRGFLNQRPKPKGEKVPGTKPPTDVRVFHMTIQPSEEGAAVLSRTQQHGFESSKTSHVSSRDGQATTKRSSKLKPSGSPPVQFDLQAPPPPDPRGASSAPTTAQVSLNITKHSSSGSEDEKNDLKKAALAVLRRHEERRRQFMMEAAQASFSPSSDDSEPLTEGSTLTFPSQDSPTFPSDVSLCSPDVGRP